MIEGTIFEHTSLGEIISIAIGVGVFIGAVIIAVAQKIAASKKDKPVKIGDRRMVDEKACDERHSATEKSFCLKLDAVEEKMRSTKELVGIELGHVKEKVDVLFSKVDDVHVFMGKINGAVNGNGERGQKDLATKLEEINNKIDKWLR